MTNTVYDINVPERAIKIWETTGGEKDRNSQLQFNFIAWES